MKQLVLSLLSFLPIYLAAQAPSTIFDKLTASEGIELTLETDLTTFVGQKKTNNYLPGTLTTQDGKTYAVEVRPRGRYRRKVSQVPPMKIRFAENDLRAENLDTLNEIKIALPCFFTEQGNQLIVKEYLAYKMFEKVSPACFRTGLVKLTLKDTNPNGTGTKKVLAIFVEDEEEVARRIDSEPEEEYGIPLAKYDQEQAALVALYQYFIGNTDWDFAMHRNVQLFRKKDSGKIFVLPYDFDFSGFVSAPYASPSSESGVKSVRDRYLMSDGVDGNSLKTAVNTLKEKEKELYQLCRSKHLNGEVENTLIRFMGLYFDTMRGKEEPPKTMNFKEN